MESKELLQVAQKAMLALGFINEKQLVAEGFSDELKSAWNKFCHSNLGFRFYAGRVPSPERLSIDAMSKLVTMSQAVEKAKVDEAEKKAKVEKKEPEKVIEPAKEPEATKEQVVSKEPEKEVEAKSAEKEVVSKEDKKVAKKK